MTDPATEFVTEFAPEADTLPLFRRLAARPCPAPFTPRLVTWAERQAAQAGWMAERLASGKPGIYVNNAEPSVSKTGAMLRLMAEHKDKRFVFFAPSHALLADVYTRAVAAGIPASDLFIAQGLDRLCDHPDRAVLTEAALGRDIRARWCDALTGRCGRAASCAWHTQREAGAAARILLAPAAYLARENHHAFLLAKAWGNDTRDAIVIDEDASGYLNVRRDVDVHAIATWGQALVEAGADGPYGEAQRALLDALDAFLTDPEQDRLDLLLPLPTTGMAAYRADRRRLRAVLEARFALTDEPDRTPLFEALLREAQEEGLVFHRTNAGHARTSRPVPVLPRKPVFLLDGTAVPAYYDRLLRKTTGIDYFLPPTAPAERDYIKPAGRLVQVVDGGWSRTQLRNPRKFDRLVTTLRAFVRSRRGRPVLLVTYKDGPEARYESRFREALGDLGVEVAHFGNIRGLDRFAGWDVLVVGTFRLAPESYLEDARDALGLDLADTTQEPMPQVLPTSTAGSYEVHVDRFREPALQAVFEQKTLAELVQAIARSRVLVPGNEDATVVVFSDFPLPGLLVEPLRLADLEAELGLGEGLQAPSGPDDKTVASALAAVLAEGGADVPARVPERVSELVEFPVGAERLARLWRPEAARVDLQARWDAALRAQGVVDAAERAGLVARYGAIAPQVAGPFRVATSRGPVTLQAPSGDAGVAALIASARRLKERAVGD